MLSKKHYEAIAKIIKERRDYTKYFVGSHLAICTCEDIARYLADYFEQEYCGDYKFDRKRFLAACGLEG